MIVHPDELAAAPIVDQAYPDKALGLLVGALSANALAHHLAWSHRLDGVDTDVPDESGEALKVVESSGFPLRHGSAGSQMSAAAAHATGVQATADGAVLARGLARQWWCEPHRPGYRARDVARFAALLRRETANGGLLAAAHSPSASSTSGQEGDSGHDRGADSSPALAAALALDRCVSPRALGVAAASAIDPRPSPEVVSASVVAAAVVALALESSSACPSDSSWWLARLAVLAGHGADDLLRVVDTCCARPRAGAQRELEQLGRASHAVGCALLAFFAGGANARDGVHAALRNGHGEPVIAALAGAFAGARFGAASLPSTWSDRLVGHAAVAVIADRLVVRHTARRGDSVALTAG